MVHAVVVTDIKVILLCQQKAAAGIGKSRIQYRSPLGNADCIPLERRQLFYGQRIFERLERFEFLRKFFGLQFGVEKSQFSFVCAPAVGRELEMSLIKSAPPEEVRGTVSPAVIQCTAQEDRLQTF